MRILLLDSLCFVAAWALLVAVFFTGGFVGLALVAGAIVLLIFGRS